MNGLSIADAKGYVYEFVRGPKRKIKLGEQLDEGIE